MSASTAAFVETTQAVKIGRVLIATDFSLISEVALSYAMQMADAHNASLYVLHVANQTAQPLPTMEFEPLPEDYGLKWGQEQFALLEKSAILARYEHWLMLETGEPSKVIREAVTKNQIDLLVVGTHGHGWLAQVLMGSVAEEVFRDVTCPVLTVGRKVQKNDQRGFKRILCATDFCAGSRHALRYALSLAKSGAELVLLHAITSGGWMPTEAQRMIRESEDHLERLILRDQCAGAQPRVIAEFGSPAEVITRLAIRERADLIVMGAHASSRTAATRLPWTVAHQVLHDADCPVLTVRDKAVE